MDTQLEVEFSSFHLDTLPPFNDEVKAAVKPTITARKFKIRSAHSIASLSPDAPIRKFQIGGRRRSRGTSIEQNSTVQYNPQGIPRITVTEPLEPPSDLGDDSHPETDSHQPASSSFLEVPSYDSLTRNFDEILVSELGFDQSNFAPSSPRGKEEWLNKWAEKGNATRRRTIMWTFDVPTAKEAMRVEDDQVFLPAVTTETPRARRLDSFGEDYAMESNVFESSGLDQWREEDNESFDLLEEDDELEKMGSQLENHTTVESSEQSRYTITHHFDELYDWENDGKEEQHEVDTHEEDMITQARNSKESTDSSTKDPSEKLDQTAIVAEMRRKWGPDRFDRWCEEYATPISEAIWDEAAIDLEEFSGFQSEPAPAQGQGEDEAALVLTPRRHSFPRADPPPRRYLRTRRSMQATQERKDDVVTRLRLMRMRLERWTESRDSMCYDGDFQDFEEDE